MDLARLLAGAMALASPVPLCHAALIAGHPQSLTRNPDGAFQLFRIGDAVSARNTHAAIYDALRLVKDI